MNIMRIFKMPRPWKSFCILLAVAVLATMMLLTRDSAMMSHFKSNKVDAVQQIPSIKTNTDRRTAGIKVDAVQQITSIKTNTDRQTAGIKSIKQPALAQTQVTEVISTHAPQEVHHIGFLKVHKAASSTMQNIFFRFGLKRNLTFVFTQHPNYFSRTVGKSIPLVKPRLRNGGYDILCNHGVFDYRLYSSLLPNDTVYIGIVRDPLSLFISSVNYYTQPSQAIDYIKRVPEKRVQNLIRFPEKYDRSFFSYTKNLMGRDFGFQPSDDRNQVDKKLADLDKIFKLVLLVEYFDESLVLMKRHLHWTIKDILYIPNNVYGKGYSLKDLTPSDIVKFSTLNSLDYSVYNFFYRKFWKQFDAESRDIYEEVRHFKRVLQTVFTFCNGNSKDSIHDNTDQLQLGTTDWNEAFTINRSECEYLKMDELKFITLLREKQGSELRKTRTRRGF